MSVKKTNIFDLEHLSLPLKEEDLERLSESDGGWVERIISTGHTTPQGEWYDQATDEWVLLLQGEAILEFDDNSQTPLGKGDYVFLPAGLKHRVRYTSQQPSCIWLAIHFNTNK